jgi:hypothetical protein
MANPSVLEFHVAKINQKTRVEDFKKQKSTAQLASEGRIICRQIIDKLPRMGSRLEK